jgi:hypothetical protein
MTMTTINAHADHRGAEAAPNLFDDWFDPISSGLRERVRGFIETMLETELEAVPPVRVTGDIRSSTTMTSSVLQVTAAGDAPAYRNLRCARDRGPTSAP